MLPSLGALKGVGSGLYNMGRGALFLGASKGATGAGKTMNALGHAVPLAPAVAGSFKATSNQPGFQPQSTIKASSDSRGEPLHAETHGVNHEPQEKWYERAGGPADLAARGALIGGGLGFIGGHQGANSIIDLLDRGTPNHLPPSPRERLGFGSLGSLAGMALGGTVGGAYGTYKDHKAKKLTAEKTSAELPTVVARALLAKVASGPGFDWHRPVNALSYAAFAAPYLSQTVHDNHRLTTALNAAGLLGLGVTSADSLAKGDGLAGYDLAGLGLMGAGLIHGGLRPDVKTAGFGNMLRNATFAAMLHSSGTMPQEAFHAMSVGKKMVNPIAQAMPSVRALGNTMRPPATLGALAPRPV